MPLELQKLHRTAFVERGTNSTNSCGADTEAVGSTVPTNVNDLVTRTDTPNIAELSSRNVVRNFQSQTAISKRGMIVSNTASRRMPEFAA